MKIERINKGSWGKVRAFFDVRTDEGFVIKGFTLVEGINGKFVGFPSKKNEQSWKIFKDDVKIVKKLNLNVKLRPHNLDPLVYFNLTKEYEKIK